MAKIGRNDPCPCGSGKKYKRCCLDTQESLAQLDDVQKHAITLRAQRREFDRLVARSVT